MFFTRIPVAVIDLMPLGGRAFDDRKISQPNDELKRWPSLIPLFTLCAMCL
ncbi:MAG: hypothetical protein ACUVSA_06135 [Desulfosoma sp.]|uniref:hypothetical protein n=1 Tax=Desulfosoma sp. TaxID=2603217 RepID=UPI00404A934A